MGRLSEKVCALIKRICEPNVNCRLFFWLMHGLQLKNEVSNLHIAHSAMRLTCAVEGCCEKNILRKAWFLQIIGAMSRKEGCSHTTPASRCITYRGHSGVYRKTCAGWCAPLPPKKRRNRAVHSESLSQYTLTILVVSRIYLYYITLILSLFW